MATNGEGQMLVEVMAERVSKTNFQNGARTGQAQNMWPRLAGPKWHRLQFESTPENIRASLLLDPVHYFAL